MRFSRRALSFPALLSKLPVALSAALLLPGLAPGEAPAKCRNTVPNIKQARTVGDVSNPQPLDHDFILPMPCDLKMVLRVVAVPLARDEKGNIAPYRFRVGIPADELRGGAREQEHMRSGEGRLVGDFALEDLPESWRKNLPPALRRDADRYRFSFMGKYEVSRAQWNAMLGQCSGDGKGGFPPDGKLPQDLPRVGVSRSEVKEAMKKYNLWLRRQPGLELPWNRRAADRDKGIGYVDLPIEAEWEFAARGGHEVDETRRDERDIPPLPEGERLAHYGWFNRSSDEGPSSIGTCSPFPLGLFDIVGNVKERTNSEYKVDERVAGFVVKGGSYQSPNEYGVRPGWNTLEEDQNTGEGTIAEDLGFRVVLTTNPGASKLPAKGLTRGPVPDDKGPPGPDPEETLWNKIKEIIKTTWDNLKEDWNDVMEGWDKKQLYGAVGLLCSLVVACILVVLLFRYSRNEEPEAAPPRPGTGGGGGGGGFPDGVGAIVRREVTLFLLIDCSGSMRGQKMEAVNTAIREVLPEIGRIGRSDADVKIAALLFSSDCAWMRDRPVPAGDFRWKDVAAGGRTNLGAAFAELAGKLSGEAFLSSSSAPVAIFLLSDGMPTDDSWQNALAALRANKWFKYAAKAAVAIGNDADRKVLKAFTGDPGTVLLSHTPESLREMIRFVAITLTRINGKPRSARYMLAEDIHARRLDEKKGGISGNSFKNLNDDET